MPTTPKSWAMLHAKCPRCRRGNIYKGPAYTFGSNKMYEHCPRCNLHYEIEPGYFYAAMYISYGNNVLEAAAIAFLTFIVTHNTTSPWLYLSTLIGGCLALAPLNYRYSRIILLYWLSPKIHYQPQFDTDDKAGNI
jgi:uncharacterized protein (DUF983 family)